MSPPEIDNSLLTLMLGDGTLEPTWPVTPVPLQVGPLSAPQGAAWWAYFPQDALIGIGADRSDHAAVALVGRHGGVFGPPEGQRSLRAHVIAPGWAYRVDGTAAHNEPTREAQWLLHAAAATQGLIGQIAQWSFCMQHHTPMQRLASWLLHWGAQTAAGSFRLPLHAMPSALRQCVMALSVVSTDAQQHSGIEVNEGVLSVSQPQRLLAQACTCHQHIALRKS